MFSALEGISWVRDVKVVGSDPVIKRWSENKLQVGMVSYDRITDKFVKKIKEVRDAMKSEGIKILVSHVGIAGAEVGSNHIIRSGEITLNELLVSSFDLVLLGHYHKSQKLSDHVYYVGSPLQTTFGEEGNDNGVMIVDSSFGKLSYSFRKLEASKRARVQTFRIDTPEEIVDLVKDVKYVRIITSNRKFDVNKLKRMPEMVGRKLKVVITGEVKSHNLEASVVEMAQLDPLQVVRTYAERKKFDLETTGIGLKITEEVMKGWEG